MLPDRVSNPGPLTYESGVLPIALRGPARFSYNRTLFLEKQQAFIRSWMFVMITIVYCDPSIEPSQSCNEG